MEARPMVACAHCSREHAAPECSTDAPGRSAWVATAPKLDVPSTAGDIERALLNQIREFGVAAHDAGKAHGRRCALEDVDALLARLVDESAASPTEPAVVVEALKVARKRIRAEVR